MVELHSSGSLVNESSLYAIEHEMNGENVNNVISELQRERQKNAQLMERISVLEAQMQGREKEPLVSGGKFLTQNSMENKCKKMKVARSGEINRGSAVNWMHMNEADVLHSGRLKESNFTADFEDTGNSDENGEEEVTCDKKVNPNPFKQEGIRQVKTDSLVSCSSNQAEPSSEPKEIDSQTCTDQETKRVNKTFLQRQPSSKVAFCPKEVRRIVESKELLEKNAQSHTIRKIIVFASLGLRHGCEDMYELDFNHFSILRKGEPFQSSNDPGEHVLYENPGISRKMFYPNRHNPRLCPVQILEEEKAMRPPDDSCPSCLFLCIKYGGRARNIPLTEYVRQRMGRNKLKSFGPAICQMAKLVHIRGGSFFFKALGITLLFVAGFPDDLVQREAKYRNFDLLQKYYRKDEDAEGEELFLSHPVIIDTNGSLNSPQSIRKTTSKRLKCKRTDSASKVAKSSVLVSTFESKGYASIQNPANTAAQSKTCEAAPYDLISATNPMISSINPHFHQCDQPSHPVIPSIPASGFIPMMYWHPSSMFVPYPHPSFQSFRYPFAGNYISMFPQPYYGSTLPNNPIPHPSKGCWKGYAASENVDSESNCGSSNTEPKKNSHN